MQNYAKLCKIIQEIYCKLCNFRLYYTSLYGFQGLIMHFYSERNDTLCKIMQNYAFLYKTLIANYAI